MMGRFILFLLIFGMKLGFAINARACSCVDGGPFFTIAERAAWVPGTLIVRAEVKDHEAHGIDVKILEILSGSEEKSVIRVWGDPGHLCRLYTNGFKNGDKLVMILSRIKSAYYEDERNGDYELGGCGTFVVREEKSVIGRISASENVMSTKKFYDELNEILDKYRPDLARIFPSPAEDLLTIQVPELRDQALSARIINITGQVLQTRQLETGQQHPIDVSTFPPGIYIILFRSEFQHYTRRFIKK